MLLAALLYESSRSGWAQGLPQPVIIGLLGGGLLVFLVVVWGIERYFHLLEERQQIQSRAEAAERLVGEAYQRLEAIFSISQKFVEASDENEVVELVLRLCVDLVGASGASFVPLDEHGQPLSALRQGDMAFPGMDSWLEYLASPAVRQRCQGCDSHGVLTNSPTCPLLKGPFSDAKGMFCLPLSRGEREYGVLNLFIPNAERFDAQTQAFLRAMLDETALALEGVRLRRRELASLRQMQAVRQKNDLTALLNSLLENVQQTLESDFALLVVQNLEDCESRITLSLGSLPAQAQPFVDGILQGVIVSGEPVSLGEVAGGPASAPGVRSLLATPLPVQGRAAAGALLVGSRRAKGFSQRQLALLQTVAGQVSLLVQNANLMADLEYNTIIQERTRLAREIHDGLAQTLGFLKLQLAQMQTYLNRSELERLRKNIDLCHATISEAYQDVRQALDNLRLWPDEGGLAGWLEQTLAEFQEVSGLAATLEGGEVKTALPPEVHAQLIRIVQEALNNVRKHSQASHVWVSYGEADGDLWLEVRDDGTGFSPEDVPAASRHGLRGMRERAELIGADFQVISRPKQGAAVRLRLPLAGLHSLRNSRSGEIAS